MDTAGNETDEVREHSDQAMTQPPELSMSIFIKTCSKDYPWLKYCLQSIHKFCSGFKCVTVVCDDVDRPVSGWIHASLQEWGIPHEVFYAQTLPTCRGYLQQQAVKLQALNYCPLGIGAVLYVDSDCVFHSETTPADFLTGSRVHMYKESYARLAQNGSAATCWRPVTAAAVGAVPEFEYMRRMPLAIHSATLRHCTHRYSHWFDAIMGGKITEFSEFNALGFVADRTHPELYDLEDVEHCALRPPKCRQFWSWGGLGERELKEIKELLK